MICALAAAVIVTITAYSPRVSETDGNPWRTACLTRPQAGTVAVSQDMFGGHRSRRLSGRDTARLSGLPIFYCGDPILVNSRRYIVNDTMHPRMRRTVDVFMESTREALAHGVRRGVACPVL